MKPVEGKSELILRTASELLLKHGLRGTSMESIARSAGIAKPTLYAYFPDKTAIFEALVTQLIASWRQDFLSALTGDADIVHRVGSALTAKHKGAMKLLAGSPARRGALWRARPTGRATVPYARWRACSRARARTGPRRRGACSTADPDAARRQLRHRPQGAVPGRAGPGAAPARRTSDPPGAAGAAGRAEF